MSISLNMRIQQARRYVSPKVGTQTAYGVNALHPPYGAVQHTNAITEMQNIGATVLRVSLTWSNMQLTSGGAIDWSEPDSIYAKCNAVGMTVLFVMETTPQWANPSLTNPSIYATPAYPSAAFNTWVTAQANWFTLVVTRYPLATFEIFNETSVNYPGSFWQEGGSTSATPTAGAYAALYIACYNAGKAVSGSTIMSLAGLDALTFWSGGGGTPATTYLPIVWAALSTAGITPDAVAVHPYTGGASSQNPGIDNYPTANSFMDIGRIQALMIANGYGTVPLWVTEWGNYDGATLGEVVKAQFWAASLDLIDHTYSLRVLGPGKAAVTLACPYQLNNNSNGTTDITFTGFYNGTPLGGPNTILPSGTVFKTFTGA